MIMMSMVDYIVNIMLIIITNVKQFYANNKTNIRLLDGGVFRGIISLGYGDLYE